VIPVFERRCVVLRQLHKFPGLLAALLVSVLALSGAVLSVFPALERSGAVTAPAGTISLADLAGRIASRYPGVEQIRRAPSGKVIAFYFEKGFPASVVVDPTSGQAVADYAPSGVER
jgi:sulfite reductase (NADPH) flavoprotein alpha-component